MVPVFPLLLHIWSQIVLPSSRVEIEGFEQPSLRLLEAPMLSSSESCGSSTNTINRLSRYPASSRRLRYLRLMQLRFPLWMADSTALSMTRVLRHSALSTLVSLSVVTQPEEKTALTQHNRKKKRDVVTDSRQVRRLLLRGPWPCIRYTATGLADSSMHAMRGMRWLLQATMLQVTSSSGSTAGAAGEWDVQYEVPGPPTSMTHLSIKYRTLYQGRSGQRKNLKDPACSRGAD
ncbi:hypothetical protein VTK56DRAFT_7798 [Thermocarpiscus australiensis]